MSWCCPDCGSSACPQSKCSRKPKRTVKILSANLTPSDDPKGLEHIRIFSRTEPNRNQGTWDVKSELAIKNFVVQFPLENTEYVTHVDISSEGYVKVSLRKRVYEGTWIHVGHVDVAETIALKKLAGEKL